MEKYLHATHLTHVLQTLHLQQPAKPFQMGVGAMAVLAGATAVPDASSCRLAESWGQN